MRADRSLRLCGLPKPLHCAWIALCLLPALAFPQGSRYFRLGNPADVQTHTEGGFALIGGGADLDQAFKWMCQRSGGGDFLVLRARGDDAYNPYIKGICHLNSVATLVIPDREAAREARVADTIRHAEVVFIAGGDQANYINYWRGTPVQDALNEAIRRGVTVGGTSAGLAVLGEFVYSAQNDAPDGPDLTSARALANPYDPQVTIVRGFLTNPILRGVITDSHFTARDRMGRLLAFMARIMQDHQVSQIKGLGLDKRTAVLLSPQGSAEVIGAGSAYFLRSAHQPKVCKPGLPLTFTKIEYRRLHAGQLFDLADWTGSEGTTGTLSVEQGRLH